MPIKVTITIYLLFISLPNEIFYHMIYFSHLRYVLLLHPALQHQWLKDALSPPRKELHRRHSSDCVGTAYGMTKMAPYLSLDYQICKSMENFSTYSWLHRLALMVIGYKYTGKETAALREVFASFDYKNTGTVEVDELRHAFSLYDKYSDEEIDQIFAAVVSVFVNDNFSLYRSV